MFHVPHPGHMGSLTTVGSLVVSLHFALWGLGFALGGKVRAMIERR